MGSYNGEIMYDFEIDYLRQIIDDLKNGKLTQNEKKLFIIGIQAGLYSADEEIKTLLTQAADLCLSSDIDTKFYNN